MKITGVGHEEKMRKSREEDEEKMRNSNTILIRPKFVGLVEITFEICK